MKVSMGMKPRFFASEVSMTWPEFLRNTIRLNGIRVRLTAMEVKVCFVLLANRGKVVSDEAMMEIMHEDPDLEPDWALGCYKIFIMKLRSKGVPIENIHSRGYMIDRQRV